VVAVAVAWFGGGCRGGAVWRRGAARVASSHLAAICQISDRTGSQNSEPRPMMPACHAGRAAPRGGRRAARARAGGMMAAPTILLNPPEDSDQIQNSVRIPNEIR